MLDKKPRRQRTLTYTGTARKIFASTTSSFWSTFTSRRRPSTLHTTSSSSNPRLADSSSFSAPRTCKPSNGLTLFRPIRATSVCGNSWGESRTLASFLFRSKSMPLANAFHVSRLYIFPFCLRPSAKDQGITWVVVVLHLLVQFLI